MRATIRGGEHGIHKTPAGAKVEDARAEGGPEVGVAEDMEGIAAAGREAKAMNRDRRCANS